MRVLLDTHTFIWWSDDPGKLSPHAFQTCIDRSNEILLSVASIWEMQIKIQLGRLSLRVPLEQAIGQQITHGIDILPIEVDHVLALRGLPAHHGDPFDRLLIAQARYEQIPIISHDGMFKHYPVQVIW